MWLSDFGTRFSSDGGWIYFQFAGRATKAINKSVPFFSWEIMLKAYSLGTTRTEQGLTRFTGKDSQKADIVRMRLPGAGEGYIPNPKSEKNPKLIQMDGFEMKFDPVTGVPFTLYPIK